MIFSIFFALISIGLYVLWYKYQNEKEKLENIARHFPTPPRMPYLGHTIVTKKIGPLDPYGKFWLRIS